MEFDYEDLRDFVVCVRYMYERLRHGATKEWVEKYVEDEQPSLVQALDQWKRGRLLIYSPLTDNPTIEDRDVQMQLAALLAHKHVTNSIAFDADGVAQAVRLLCVDMLAVHGPTEDCFVMMTILHGLVVETARYMDIEGHYPVDEQAFVLAFGQHED